MYLKPATRRWANEIARAFELESHHFKLLELLASAWDEFAQAREAVAREGTTFLDRYNQPRERPEVGTARAARIAFARLLRELGLDVAAPGEPARPPVILGRR